MHPANYNQEFYYPFPPAFLDINISVEYVLRNPGFLGHDWPELNWDSMLVTLKDNSTDMTNLIADKLSFLQ